MTSMSTLKHRTLSAAIVDQLRQSILDGTYKAGAQLRQDALGEAYGVSRIPVREALFQLEAGGVSAPIDTPRGFWIVKRLD